MKIGITGTRNGANDNQLFAIAEFLEENDVEELHHGDCLGVDVEIAAVAKMLGIKTVCHPPVDESLRAFHESTEIRPALTHFARNRKIADETDLLLVVPMQNTHQSFGGTWYTHDYAVKRKKPVKIFFPGED